MGVVKRISNILFGLLMIVFAAVLFIEPQYGVYLILAVTGIILIVYGIRQLVYYCKMAKHMVGGQLILYMGLLLTLLGFFALSLHSIPQKSLMTLLIVILFFYGIVDILRAMEAKKGGAKGWKLKIAEGIIEALLALACIFFGKTTEGMSYLFAIALVIFAIDRIISTVARRNWKQLVQDFTPTSDEDDL